ncbi:MAG: rhomboid family intramembrane serine protease [Planctomycetes bacterium]|nr:rhomboid family intramembrane serine protease [Planctomycetota bacterium]
MIIPYEVDVPFDRQPFLNWLIIGVIILVFVWQMSVDPEDHEDLLLDGYNVTGLFAHMWLHGGIFHIVGNLIFLWVFGNAVCAKIGNIKYLPVYIGVGLFSAFAFNLFNDGKALGASGAINGIVGMYLVFFPLNDISCLWLMGIFTRRFTVSSYWMVLLWLAYDIYGVVAGGGAVAYTAHLGGFAMGVVLAIAMLKFGIVKMEDDERSLLRLFGMKEKVAVLVRTKSKAAAPRGPGDAAIERALRQRQEAEAADRALLNQLTSGDDGYIRFTCTCQKRIKVSNSYAGKIGKCPGCSRRITVPATSIE